MAALLVLGLVTVGVMLLRQRSPVLQELRSQIPQPDGLTFNAGTQATISPDGHWLAFPALGRDNVSRMYARSLDSLDVRPLPGSEGIIGLSPPPFWSYDSRFVVYAAAGKLKKSEVTGTPAQTIAETGLPFAQGGSWSRDGVVLYARNNSHLEQVPSTGGTPSAVTVLASGERAHRWPQFLPDGRRFLYLRASASPEKTGIYVGSLNAKPEAQSLVPLLLTNRQAWWVVSPATGKSFLLMQSDEVLFAQPFDTDTATLSGSPVHVADGVGAFAGATSGLWSVAHDGSLVYRSGGTGLPQMTWLNVNGEVVGTVGEPNIFASVALSANGKRVAFSSPDQQGNVDIWVRDLARGSTTKLTFEPGMDNAPVWSPDSTRVIFAANRGGRLDLYEKNADGSGEERLLLKSEQDKTPTSWSSDGRFLLFQSFDPKTREDIWIVPLEGDRKPFVFLNTEAQEGMAQFSPDMRWIAYQGSAGGLAQVFVRPFSSRSTSPGSAAGSQWMISTNGGLLPRWRADGKRLFYVSGNGDLMAADVEPGVTFQSGAPQRLFGGIPPATFNVSIDGDRLLVTRPSVSAGPPPPFTLVLNWLSRLER